MAKMLAYMFEEMSGYVRTAVRNICEMSHVGYSSDFKIHGSKCVWGSNRSKEMFRVDFPVKRLLARS